METQFHSDSKGKVAPDDIALYEPTVVRSVTEIGYHLTLSSYSALCNWGVNFSQGIISVAFRHSFGSTGNNLP